MGLPVVPPRVQTCVVLLCGQLDRLAQVLANLDVAVLADLCDGVPLGVNGCKQGPNGHHAVGDQLLERWQLQHRYGGCDLRLTEVGHVVGIG